MKKITVSDITLRAIEEQKLSLTFREKLCIAERLDASLVDAIELPVLSDSKENEVIYRTIASSIKNAVVKVPVVKDVESVRSIINSVKDGKLCLQVIMPVSTAMMEYSYHLKAPLMLEKISALISDCKKVCDCVEFVAVDAFRAEDGFLLNCVETIKQLGVDSISVVDTAGVAFPEDFNRVVSEIKKATDILVSVQPSDALSMSAACAVEAIKAGADGVKTSFFNNCLSMSVFAEIIRAKKYDLCVDCDVDVTNVKTIAASVDCVVDSGMASDNTQTSSVKNLCASCSLADISDVVKKLGYELSDSDVGKVYEDFKKLTVKKETIDVKELEAVIASTAMQVPSTYHLINYVVNSGNIIPATANITLEKEGEKFTGVSTGDGPIDAAFHAIEQIIGHHYELDDFQVQAVTKGRGAVGSSIIRLRVDGKLYSGNGVSTDIVGACIRAYINALNKIVYEGD